MKHERVAIENMLDHGKGAREIAGALGRAPSTVADETLRHRFVVAPRSLAGEPAPEGIGDVCERLGPFPPLPRRMQAPRAATGARGGQG